MTVSGIPHADIPRLQELLKEQVARVEEVYDRGYQNQQLRLDLEVSGGLKDVADEVAALNLGKASLVVTGYSAGQLQTKWQIRAVRGGRVQ